MLTITYIKNNIEFIIFYTLSIIFILLIIRRNWEGFYNEQHGINRLDAIIYINTYTDNYNDNYNDKDNDKYNDNKNLLMKELEKLNTNMSKVHKANKSKGVYIPKTGNKGCIQSHILALKMIKNNNWKRVLILEDNIELNMSPESFNDLLNKTIDKLDETNTNWDVIMLATLNKNIDNKVKSIPINVISSDTMNTESLKIQKIKSSRSCSAYIIKNTYVDNLLNLYDKNSNDDSNNSNNNIILNNNNNDEYLTLDQKWKELQNKDNWFSIDKDSIKQRNYL